MSPRGVVVAAQIRDSAIDGEEVASAIIQAPHALTLEAKQIVSHIAVGIVCKRSAQPRCPAQNFRNFMQGHANKVERASDVTVVRVKGVGLSGTKSECAANSGWGDIEAEGGSLRGGEPPEMRACQG